jgi:hypothetical protein
MILNDLSYHLQVFIFKMKGFSTILPEYVGISISLSLTSSDIISNNNNNNNLIFKANKKWQFFLF